MQLIWPLSTTLKSLQLILQLTTAWNPFKCILPLYKPLTLILSLSPSYKPLTLILSLSMAQKSQHRSIHCWFHALKQEFFCSSVPRHNRTCPAACAFTAMQNRFPVLLPLLSITMSAALSAQRPFGGGRWNLR